MFKNLRLAWSTSQGRHKKLLFLGLPLYFRMELSDLDHCDIYSQVAIDLAGGLPWCGGKVQTSLTHSCLDKNLKDVL